MPLDRVQDIASTPAVTLGWPPIVLSARPRVGDPHVSKP